MVLITKGSQATPGYMSIIKLLTQHLTANLSAFSSLKSQTCCTKLRVALDSNKLLLRQIICGFRGFIDNLKTFYKRNFIKEIKFLVTVRF